LAEAISLSTAQLTEAETPYTVARYFCLGVIVSIGTVFVNNLTQAVRLPLDVRLPVGVQKVEIRVKGNERIISPLGQSWDSFFLGGPTVSDDFLPERASQHQPAREAL
jgi:antitoxin VapB